MRTAQGPTRTFLLLTAAVVANLCAGLLYILSLFILPIESALGLARADMGLISSLVLISFTAGVWILPVLLSKTSRTSMAILAFTLIGGGHVVFGLDPSWRALSLGYGVGFGIGSGLAYGLALSLAASLHARVRALSIGLAFGAFAMSGILLPVLLGSWILSTPPGETFLWIGCVTLGFGLFCVAALVGANNARTKTPEAELPTQEAVHADGPFALLFLIFFLLCFIGLAIVSQAAVIAASAGIVPAGYAATALTLGYLAGSLLGAPLAERLGETKILLVLGFLALLGAAAMLLQTKFPLFMGSAIVGVTFGGSGSVMPVVLGMRYGASNISRQFGRLIIAYGIAGFLAPSIAGVLFDAVQSYAPLFSLCMVIAAIAVVATLMLGRMGKLSTRSDLIG